MTPKEPKDEARYCPFCGADIERLDHDDDCLRVDCLVVVARSSESPPNHPNMRGLPDAGAKPRAEGGRVTVKSEPLAHWSVPVSGLDQWRELDLGPADLRPGDLWLDKHGDSLRGVVRTVEQFEHLDGYGMWLEGVGGPWVLPSRRSVRVVRPLADDEDWRRA